MSIFRQGIPLEQESRSNNRGRSPYEENLSIWGVPKIRGTFLGVPIIRTVVFGGLYWGPLFWQSTIFWGEAHAGHVIASPPEQTSCSVPVIGNRSDMCMRPCMARAMRRSNA